MTTVGTIAICTTVLKNERKWTKCVMQGYSVWRKLTHTPFFYFSIGLTEIVGTDCHKRYFDMECFGTKFKAFRNLGAEWEA